MQFGATRMTNLMQAPPENRYIVGALKSHPGVKVPLDVS